jgi:hypothetical protein
MRLNSVSQPILVRLLALDDEATELAAQADQAERALQLCRDKLNGKTEITLEQVPRVQAEFNKLLQTAPAMRQAANTAQRLVSAVKAWIDGLPPDTSLQQVSVAVDGHDLTSVRKELKAATEELRVLKGAPVPSDNIGERVRSYFNELARGARPEVRGFGAGQRLEVHWPEYGNANRANLTGFNPVHCDALLTLAWLFPNEMVERLLAVIEAAASELLPPVERPARIAELQTKIEELLRIEVALVNAAKADGQRLSHNPAASPEALLGVKVATPRVPRMQRAAN